MAVAMTDNCYEDTTTRYHSNKQNNVKQNTKRNTNVLNNNDASNIWNRYIRINA